MFSDSEQTLLMGKEIKRNNRKWERKKEREWRGVLGEKINWELTLPVAMSDNEHDGWKNERESNEIKWKQRKKKKTGKEQKRNRRYELNETGRENSFPTLTERVMKHNVKINN